MTSDCFINGQAITQPFFQSFHEKLRHLRPAAEPRTILLWLKLQSTTSFGSSDSVFTSAAVLVFFA